MGSLSAFPASVCFGHLEMPTVTTTQVGHLVAASSERYDSWAMLVRLENFAMFTHLPKNRPTATPTRSLSTHPSIA